LNGAPLPGAEVHQWIGMDSGDYTVVVTNSDGCSYESAPVTVTEFAEIPTPTITQGSDTLYASGTGTFQWYFFGSPIPGANEPFIETAISGDYSVTVSDTNGCSSPFGTYTYIATGISATNDGVFAVYPNPTNGLITIQLRNNPASGDRFDVIDASGKCVMSDRLNSTVQVVDLSGNAPGLYLVRVIQAGSMTFQRIAKN
jgi:hypothetical protein